MTTSQSFGKNLNAFKELRDAPWGRLRYTVALANLKRHIDGNALHFLDAGGGTGLEAIPFAEQGHEVVLLDYSAEMLAEARRIAEAKGVGKRIAFHQADVVSIPALFPEPTFDVVMCHTVLDYVDNLGVALGALSHALKPGGLLSIICANRYSESYRLALQELNPKAACANLDTREIFSKVFGVSKRAYAAEDLRQPLQDAGCSTIGHYGIRCVNDYIPNNDIKRDPAFFADLERLELAMSNKFPYYLVARFFHLIAQKAVRYTE